MAGPHRRKCQVLSQLISPRPTSSAIIMVPPVNNAFTIYAFSINVRCGQGQGCPSDYVGSTSGVPPTAADLSRSSTRPRPFPDIKTRNSGRA
jgi:hypothetical protein